MRISRGLAGLLLAAFMTAASADEPMPGMTMGGMNAEMGDQIYAHALLDQFEGRFGAGGPSFRWDGQGWIGGDYDKLWVKSEGLVQSGGKVSDGDHELLYDRAISTYFDLQAGLRSDIDSFTTRNWAAFGVHGLAPLFFEVAATGYVSDSGHLAAKLQASYDLLLTQRLILQPEIELNLYSKADPGRRIERGVSDIDAGLRLRYELTRKIAPYLGATYSEQSGQTADFRLTAGIRAWF